MCFAETQISKAPSLEKQTMGMNMLLLYLFFVSANINQSMYIYNGYNII